MRVVREGRADGVRFGAAAEEPAASAAEGGQVAFGRDFVRDPFLPLLVRGERLEVERLEGSNDFERKFRLSSESVSSSAVITSVAQFLAHETVTVMSIVERFSDSFIAFK